MTVEQSGVIDGMGIMPDGSLVEMLISDHLPWDDTRHFELLAAKIEAYVGFIQSGQVVETMPAANGKPVRITVVWMHEPTLEAAQFFRSIAEQLKPVGIGFNAMTLPKD